LRRKAFPPLFQATTSALNEDFHEDHDHDDSNLNDKWWIYLAAALVGLFVLLLAVLLLKKVRNPIFHDFLQRFNTHVICQVIGHQLRFASFRLLLSTFSQNMTRHIRV